MALVLCHKFFRHYMLPLFFLLLVLAANAQALKPEDVLGEYWKDPLFGAAAAKETVQVEILHKLLWPIKTSVTQGENIRFVVTNKSPSLHVLAFSTEPEALVADDDFQQYLKEDLYHAAMEPVVDGQHTHAGTAVDNPKPIVLTMERNPSVLVRPDEFKEVIIQFDAPKDVILFCTIAGHEDEGHRSIIQVLPGNPETLDTPQLDLEQLPQLKRQSDP
jgi:uncharacterized cupredoxin-like copper-binding protein